jgi:hypothetical protein
MLLYLRYVPAIIRCTHCIAVQSGMTEYSRGVSSYTFVDNDNGDWKMMKTSCLVILRVFAVEQTLTLWSCRGALWTAWGYSEHECLLFWLFNFHADCELCLFQEKHKFYANGTCFTPVFKTTCNPGPLLPIQKERVLVWLCVWLKLYVWLRHVRFQQPCELPTTVRMFCDLLPINDLCVQFFS